MKFLHEVVDWIYDVTGHIEEGFKIIIRVVFGLSIVAAILFLLYWVGKAILGFIKYYSHFA